MFLILTMMTAKTMRRTAFVLPFLDIRMISHAKLFQKVDENRIKKT